MLAAQSICVAGGEAVKYAACLIALSLGIAAHSRADEPPGGFGAAYCAAKGGSIVTRIPEYGTNGGTPLVLAGPRQWCQFNAPHDTSSISVLLTTLITTKPSLAALAYYAEVPFSGSCTGSPGSCYCSQLGGTDLFGGITAAGGGWVSTADSTDVLDACVFPDGSSIDSYGLFYHSVGTIRGKNLAGRLRYKNPN
jgi:putative hemolysin